MTDDSRQQPIREMADTEGWTIVEGFIKERIVFHENQLLHCGLDEVMKHRNRREALCAVLSFVDDIASGKTAESDES